ncbi:MAG: hypothetical protein PHR69_05350 [Sphaerochaeta sp.]|nr:hypothetical protein [Sphaerochaeta sp.]
MKTCTFTLATVLMLLLLTISCGCNQEGPEVINLFAQQDSTPPKLLGAKAVDSCTITIRFNERLRDKTTSLQVNGVENANFLNNGEVITLYLTSPMEIASSTRLEGRVEDLWGNSTCFSLEVWAHNPDRAEVLINEFSTKGSGNNPDRVELLVTKRGNLAGITIANGVGPYARDRCILGDKEAFAGDFLVISFQEGGTGVQYHSEHLGGLSANNGCITVTESPDWESTIIDAVLYSNKSTTTYGGFGSRETEEGALMLYQERQGDSPLATNGIDSTNSTATRTHCRDSCKDTNSERDWYVCDTKGATFGAENSSFPYQS